jgi:antitoxin CptB
MRASPAPPPDSLDERRRRLRFRAGRRGTHENDLLLGRFAANHVGTMDQAALDEFETLLDLPDVDLFDWIAGRAPVPPEHDSPLLRRLISEANGE